MIVLPYIFGREVDLSLQRNRMFRSIQVTACSARNVTVSSASMCSNFVNKSCIILYVCPCSPVQKRGTSVLLTPARFYMLPVARRHVILHRNTISRDSCGQSLSRLAEIMKPINLRRTVNVFIKCDTCLWARGNHFITLIMVGENAALTAIY